MKINFDKINQFIDNESLQGISYKGYSVKRILNILFKALELQIADLNSFESANNKVITELLKELPKTWFYPKDQLKENLITMINQEQDEEKLLTLFNSLNKSSNPGFEVKKETNKDKLSEIYQESLKRY